jgi:hypothetical protein
MPDGTIQGGYILKARSIQNSAISHAPPHVREIWDYLLRKANHRGAKRNSLVVERGQCFTSYEEIIEDLSWSVGWRKERYTKHQCEISMKWLRKATMITTRKTTRGMIISVVNYDYYQNPKNYENHTESPKENGTRATDSPHYKQECKEVRSKIPSASDDAANSNSFIITKKKRKLNGNRYQDFSLFWEAFDYKRGRAETGDAWLDIEDYTPELVSRILAAASREAAIRPSLISSGKTPKMAQGWITARRWEDEVSDTQHAYSATSSKQGGMKSDQIRALREEQD